MMTGTCKDIIKLPYSVTIEKEFDLDLNAFKKYLWKHYEHDADYIWDNINIILDEYSRSKNHIIPYESLEKIGDYMWEDKDIKNDINKLYQ